MPQSPIVRAIAVTCLVIAAALGAYVGWKYFLAGDEQAGKIGSAFALTDQHGQVRRDTDFRGQYLLIYFGYTHCPDLCPTALQDMTNALNKLADKAGKVTPIFVTVDPQRDTVAVLADYVKPFHPRLVALTGDEAAVHDLARAYRVFYDRAKAEGDPQAQTDYLVDHSSVIFLMGPNGEYRQIFQSGYTADSLADALRPLL